MVASLKLFVYIYRLGGSSFSVSIKPSETVDDLKEAIKKKNPNDLSSVDAARLTLYQVELDDEDEILENLDEESLTAKLQPSCELSDIFPKPPAKGKVCIIVTLPGKG